MRGSRKLKLKTIKICTTPGIRLESSNMDDIAGESTMHAPDGKSVLDLSGKT